MSLTDQQQRLIDAARDKAFVLYEGTRVPHRSCGIALAETFNLPTAPFQCLRRGGITGEGECGAIKAGELVLGAYLGDPDPTGPVTSALREAAKLYREEWTRRLDRGPSSRSSAARTVVRSEDIVCNTLTGPFEDFMGDERKRFCTNLAAGVAEIVAEVLVRFGVELEVTPIADLEAAPEGTARG